MALNVQQRYATPIQSISVAAYVFQIIYHSFFREGLHDFTQSCRKTVCWLWARLQGCQCCQVIVRKANILWRKARKCTYKLFYAIFASCHNYKLGLCLGWKGL